MTLSGFGEAAKEFAKIVPRIGDDVSSALNYVANTVGKVPISALQLAGGDWINEQRERNLFRLRQKTANIIAESKVDVVSEPPLRVIKDLLEHAADENREILVNLWAGLLASALDQRRQQNIRREFFRTADSLEPEDVLLFDHISVNFAKAFFSQPNLKKSAKEIRIADPILTVSRKKLEKEGLIWETTRRVKISDKRTKGERGWKMTQYGIAFRMSCTRSNTGSPSEPIREDGTIPG
jgi:hypothetical protein